MCSQKKIIILKMDFFDKLNEEVSWQPGQQSCLQKSGELKSAKMLKDAKPWMSTARTGWEAIVFDTWSRARDRLRTTFARCIAFMCLLLIKSNACIFLDIFAPNLFITICYENI